jgi:uncharacterized protein
VRIFVDTGAWLAVNDRDDRWHSAAIRFLTEITGTAVLFYTTDYIIDETVTLIRFRVSHRRAAAFLDSLPLNRNLVCAAVTGSLLGKAEHIFRKYGDKKWSFTDCVSFAFMDEMQLKDVFGFDSNFRQYRKALHPSRGG